MVDPSPFRIRRFGLPAAHRIRQRRIFLAVQGEGRKYVTDHFLFFTRLNGLPQSRLGVTVSRKVGHAVCRNRIKRLIREVFRQSQASLPAGWDIVIIARSAARSIEFAEVQSEFRAFCRRQHKYHDWPAEGQP